MIVIADTTPLHYLILIGEAEILGHLFGSILVPQAVVDELSVDRTPKTVKDWLGSKPSWLQVRQPSFELSDVAKSLGRGERAAIALAVELEADALLLDDKRAKNEARRRNIPVITILNILEFAAEKSLLDLPGAITRLRLTNFYLPAEDAIREALERDKQRKEDEK